MIRAPNDKARVFFLALLFHATIKLVASWSLLPSHYPISYCLCTDQHVVSIKPYRVARVQTRSVDERKVEKRKSQEISLLICWFSCGRLEWLLLDVNSQQQFSACRAVHFRQLDFHHSSVLCFRGGWKPLYSLELATGEFWFSFKKSAIFQSHNPWRQQLETQAAAFWRDWSFRVWSEPWH